ncbi:MAG: hypothetical protein ACOX62_07110 [Christensenellales bacterium]
MAIKTYVAVGFDTDELGIVQPRWLAFHRQYMTIDRVLESRQAIAVYAGGNGLRYTIRIGQRRTILFQDSFNRWFVEEKNAPKDSAR